MISIDRVYKTVLTFINSDIRGNVKPTEARLAIYDVCNQIVEEYFYDLNRAVNRENRGLINGGLENIPGRLREKINHFLVEAELTFDDPYFNLPEDYRYIDNLLYDGAKVIEFAKTNREFQFITNNVDTTPSETYPLALKVGDKIKISPDTIQDDVTISYLRKPILPNWTYQVIGGAEIFDPSNPDFADIDLHTSEEHNVVMRTLNRFGINLKEEDIIAVTTNNENQGFNQENAS